MRCFRRPCKYPIKMREEIANMIQVTQNCLDQFYERRKELKGLYWEADTNKKEGTEVSYFLHHVLRLKELNNHYIQQLNHHVLTLHYLEEHWGETSQLLVKQQHEELIEGITSFAHQYTQFKQTSPLLNNSTVK